MPPKKVLMITKVTVHWDKLEAFNEWWEKGSLPTWRTHGANYIGSYENYLGGKKNEIIRVTEFDDFKKWEKSINGATLVYTAPTQPPKKEPSKSNRLQAVSRVSERIRLVFNILNFGSFVPHCFLQTTPL